MREGKRIPVGGIVLVAATGDKGPPRVGLSVSKGIGNAVTRNRAKRRLRHAVREVQLPPDMDYVIIARKSVVDAPYPTIVGWIRRAAEESRND
ncbi:MAG: ribonuclease P protein component [Actinobacteria bacterium]|nr:MAG: ribonuclease P protein component [Actinomycetota bacterium]REK37771.1 MAG: ribonuclease P protein component [Actinomycetota bacterium]